MITLDRLSDLAGTYFLTGNCDRCNHHTKLYPNSLIAKYGDILISDFRQRITCSKCAIRTEDIRIVFDSPMQSPSKT